MLDKRVTDEWPRYINKSGLGTLSMPLMVGTSRDIFDHNSSRRFYGRIPKGIFTVASEFKIKNRNVNCKNLSDTSQSQHWNSKIDPNQIQTHLVDFKLMRTSISPTNWESSLNVNICFETLSISSPRKISPHSVSVVQNNARFVMFVQSDFYSHWKTFSLIGVCYLGPHV